MKIRIGKRSAIVLSTIVLLFSLILSSFLYINYTKPYNGSVESITIGATLLESTGPLFVAKDRNFFSNNGLNLTIKYYDVGLNAVNDLLAGKVDMALSAEYILVSKALGNQKIQTIGSIAKTDFAYVVARKDHGIRDISDLYGKNIGVVRGTVMEFYLGQFLELNRLSISNVNLVNITLAQSVDVLVNGEVDAVISFPPFVETAQQKLGTNAVVWDPQGSQSLYGIVTARNDWISLHPEVVKRFLRAVSQTEDYMTRHPAESKVIVGQTMNFTSGYMDIVWARNEYTLSLDQSLVLALENEARWMINRSLASQTVIPDFTNYISFEGLTAVNPDLVNVIH